MVVVILLGAPGAGKGTQARRLAETLSLPHISTGDLFRENLSQGTELGQRAKGYMELGQLVPDELVVDMLFDRVGRPDCAEGYLLDGFPRTVAQAETLDARLQSQPLVANLEVDDEKIVGRAAGRLTCKDCGNIQHKEFSPPAVEGKCDNCGGELTTRKDDQPDTVRERLTTYHRETKPVADYYSGQGILHNFDGDRAPDDVFADLQDWIQAARTGGGGQA